MNDVMVRSRYPRHNIPARRRSRYGKEKSKLPSLLLKQFVACVVLFLVIMLAKSINTNFTNYITEKVKFVLNQNFELNSIFSTIDKSLSKLSDDKITKKDGSENGDIVDGAKPETSVLSASTDESGDLVSKMIVPVKGVLSSAFGNRKDPVTGLVKKHEGIDIDAGNEDNIAVSLDGVVIDTGSSKTYGRYIRIRHDERFETVYAHCSEILAVEGQRLKQGEIIAKVGNTGASVGAHLHFEVWRDGKAVDPLEFVNMPINEKQAQ